MVVQELAQQRVAVQEAEGSPGHLAAGSSVCGRR